MSVGLIIYFELAKTKLPAKCNYVQITPSIWPTAPELLVYPENVDSSIKTQLNGSGNSNNKHLEVPFAVSHHASCFPRIYSVHRHVTVMLKEWPQILPTGEF